MTPPIAHAELIASYRKVAAEAARKAELVKAAAAKGPKTIATVSETAAKAARRRDVLASKLAKLGVDVKDIPSQ
ncbi:hypothetical protein [Comamonas terrigena]|uniref:hypothetical protein n=1 Tax=Comamonas terrigena TaxID=32013 RepID=UPI002447DBC1|nr:hypothetical protein [Comamonas terrigena]MDH1701491.1 hypothetical protein [Comamonas terrigena]